MVAARLVERGLGFGQALCQAIAIADEVGSLAIELRGALRQLVRGGGERVFVLLLGRSQRGVTLSDRVLERRARGSLRCQASVEIRLTCFGRRAFAFGVLLSLGQGARGVGYV